MKTCLLIMAGVGVAFSNYAQTISGRIVGTFSTDLIYLNHYPDLMGYEDKGMRTDSVMVENGVFSFRFEIGETPRFARLIQQKRIPGKKGWAYLGQIDLFLANDSIVVEATDSLKNARIYNSEVNYDFIAMKEYVKPAEERASGLERQFWKEKSEAPESIRASRSYQRFSMKRTELAHQELAEAYESFIASFPNSWMSLYAFDKRARANQYLTNDIMGLYQGLSNRLKASAIGKAFGERIAKRLLLQPGAIAPEVNLPNIRGEQIRLSDYQGKYVLLEFWSTSCGGCRAEAPHLLEAYAKYREKGFDILSISLDDARYTKREAWLAAIAHDGTGAWQQVCDFEGWKTQAAITYDIQSIPQNYLIGPDGKMLSENLRGADLHDQLEALFGF